MTPASPAAGDRYALVVSALVPYKRVDRGHRGLPARAASRSRLSATARSGRGSNAPQPADVPFLGRRSDEDVRDLYRGAARHAAARRGRLRHRAGRSPGLRFARSSRSAAAARSKPSSPDETGVLVDDPSAPAFADGIGRAMARRFDPAAHPPPCRTFQPRAIQRRDGRAHHGGRVSMVKRHNRLLVAFYVVVRRAARPFGLRARLHDPVSHGPHPDYQGHPAAAAVHQPAAVHRGARPARVPPAEPLSPAPRPLARGRLLRRLRRQHPRGRVRHHRDVVRADLHRAQRPRRVSRCRRPSGACSSS